MTEPSSGHLRVVFGLGALLFALVVWLYLSSAPMIPELSQDSAQPTYPVQSKKAVPETKTKPRNEEIGDGRTPQGLLGAESVKDRIRKRARALAKGEIASELEASARRGELLFKKHFGAAEVLGPTFNEDSCVTCHSEPEPLGRGKPEQRTKVLGAGIRAAFGDHKYAGVIFEHARRLPGAAPQDIPKVMKPLGTRRPPSLRGLGWIEAVPAKQIVAGPFCAKPEPPAEEICGWTFLKERRGRGSHRFGIKVPATTIDEFVASAFFFEMGLTSSHPGFHEDVDQIPDPEISDQVVVDVANYIALSSAPGADLDDVEGLALFQKSGCADCHWGDFEVEGMKTPQFFSDLLAHDLGPGLAETDYDELTPPGHFRTAPLWGFSDHAGPYLTGGGAKTPRDAILLHGGEAKRSRALFEGLSSTEQQRLIRFLMNL